MTSGEWEADYARPVAVFVNGDAIVEPDPRGRRQQDDSFLLLFNPTREVVSFAIPAPPYNGRWEIVLETSAQPREGTVVTQSARLQPHSVCVLRRPADPQTAGSSI